MLKKKKKAIHLTAYYLTKIIYLLYERTKKVINREIYAYSVPLILYVISIEEKKKHWTYQVEFCSSMMTFVDSLFCESVTS